MNQITSKPFSKKHIFLFILFFTVSGTQPVCGMNWIAHFCNTVSPRIKREVTEAQKPINKEKKEGKPEISSDYTSIMERQFLLVSNEQSAQVRALKDITKLLKKSREELITGYPIQERQILNPTGYPNGYTEAVDGKIKEITNKIKEYYEFEGVKTAIDALKNAWDWNWKRLSANRQTAMETAADTLIKALGTLSPLDNSLDSSRKLLLKEKEDPTISDDEGGDPTLIKSKKRKTVAPTGEYYSSSDEEQNSSDKMYMDGSGTSPYKDESDNEHDSDEEVPRRHMGGSGTSPYKDESDNEHDSDEESTTPPNKKDGHIVTEPLSEDSDDESRHDIINHTPHAMRGGGGNANSHHVVNVPHALFLQEIFENIGNQESNLALLASAQNLEQANLTVPPNQIILDETMVIAHEVASNHSFVDSNQHNATSTSTSTSENTYEAPAHSRSSYSYSSSSGGSSGGGGGSYSSGGGGSYSGGASSIMSSGPSLSSPLSGGTNSIVLNAPLPKIKLGFFQDKKAFEATKVLFLEHASKEFAALSQELSNLKSLGERKKYIATWLHNSPLVQSAPSLKPSIESLGRAMTARVKAGNLKQVSTKLKNWLTQVTKSVHNLAVRHLVTFEKTPEYRNFLAEKKTVVRENPDFNDLFRTFLDQRSEFLKEKEAAVKHTKDILIALNTTGGIKRQVMRVMERRIGTILDKTTAGILDFLAATPRQKKETQAAIGAKLANPETKNLLFPWAEELWGEEDAKSKLQIFENTPDNQDSARITTKTIRKNWKDKEL